MSNSFQGAMRVVRAADSNDELDTLAGTQAGTTSSAPSRLY